jgi:acetyl-CoA carboxylase alpha subunit
MSAAENQFEEPLVELRRRIEELEGFPEAAGRVRELAELREELTERTVKIYGGLSRWQKTLVARHSDRPYTLDYVASMMEEWIELHGDRAYADDAAIVCGLARFRGRSVCRRRSPEGPWHQGADRTQLRPAAARGLPQGAARDAARPSGSACRS